MRSVLSLFSGIGAFEKALDNLEVPYELVNFCEFDKYAAKSYCAIHGVDESKNLGDITKVDETKLPKDIDILTYGFPCQDISLAGKQKGLFNEDGTQTRSGLFFDALRIIEATKPKIAIAENVKNLVGKKFNAQFQVVLASLESAGYNNYWKVLNAKDFGVPQNRERVFIVSIRKDIDHGLFQFPEAFPLEKRLKDVLEEVVDEKYYLSDRMIATFDRHKARNAEKGNGFGWNPTDGDCVAFTLLASASARPTDNYIKEQPTLIGGMQKNQSIKNDGVCTTLTSAMGCGGGYVPMVVEEPTLKQIGQMYPNSGNPQASRIYDSDGISLAMDTCSGGNRMPKVVVAYDEQNQYIRKDGCVGTIMTDGSSPKKNNRIIEVTDDTRVLVREATKKGYAEAYEGDSINLEQPNSTTRRGRVGKGVAQTLTTSCNQAVVEPQALRQVRTEYGKEIRKAYESGDTKEKWGNMKQFEPRTDGVANTLSTVQKDNYVVEPINPMPDGTCRTLKNQYGQTAIANTVRTGSMGATMVAEQLPDEVPQNEKNQIYKVKDKTVSFIGKNHKEVEYPVDLSNGTFKIRKLTPKECFRLMGFDDESFHKAEAVNSNTQLYKQAGNSIVVDVLEELFCMMLDEDGNLYV